MRSNIFKEVKTSLYIFSAILLVMILFYLVATMFISMGYEGFQKSKLISAEISNLPTIVIDPGHGGIDSGATANGLIEKELNLEMSMILSQFLTTFGYDCTMTRSEDVLLYDPQIAGSRKSQDLKNRVLYAEQYNNACFISLHMNKFHQSDCCGLQVFYSENNPDSQLLAEKLRCSVVALQPNNNRKIKNGTNDIYLLERLYAPAVLVECGFLSNPNEANLFKNDEYKKALTLAIYCGIAEFMELK